MWRTVRRFSVWSCCLLQMRRIRKKSANLTESMCTLILFSLFNQALQRYKKKGGAKQKRDEFLLSGLMRRLQRLIGISTIQNKSEEIASDCVKTRKKKKKPAYVHNRLQTILPFSNRQIQGGTQNKSGSEAYELFPAVKQHS